MSLKTPPSPSLYSKEIELWTAAWALPSLDILPLLVVPWLISFSPRRTDHRPRRSHSRSHPSQHFVQLPLLHYFASTSSPAPCRLPPPPLRGGTLNGSYVPMRPPLPPRSRHLLTNARQQTPARCLQTHPPTCLHSPHTPPPPHPTPEVSPREGSPPCTTDVLPDPDQTTGGREQNHGKLDDTGTRY